MLKFLPKKKKFLSWNFFLKENKESNEILKNISFVKMESSK
jgi:hypothetical protein